MDYSGTPTTTPTRSQVEDLLDRVGEGDPEHIAALYADDADGKLSWPQAEHGRAATPWIRHRATGADAAAHYRELAEHHVAEEAATRVEHVLVDGVHAVVPGGIRQTARSTATPYRARFAMHLTVEDGLITRHHVYEDSLAATQAFEDR
ncbi:nuclear transport factor 2 family protein [Streptomyces sp. NPDC058257]|uniref:nuclear transport factor 2 family protein n=1 Tax=Streptomyces sp. NPDC058257 TaxID=3346409 RepID=UPI0036E5B70B